MIFPGDVRIKDCIENGLADIRKHDFLIDDIFSVFITDPDLAKKYGQKEINAAKDFILNNKIPVVLGLRLDKEEVPCITISIGASQEADDLATMGDLSTCIETLTPDQISKPIKYIIPPFKIKGYDKNTGIISTDVDLSVVRKGMVILDPKTGNGYIIQDVTPEGIQIDMNLKLKCQEMGIIPQYQIYKARRERATFRENYDIGCHAHGDPSTLIFLHSVVVYILLRYREGLLEKNDFQISSISSTDMMLNRSFQTISDKVYSRFITLKGQVEHTWIKTPTRVIESVVLGDGEGGTGIKIISNKNDKGSLVDPVWETIDREEG
jgi:hypothetical protein